MRKSDQKEDVVAGQEMIVRGSKAEGASIDLDSNIVVG